MNWKSRKSKLLHNLERALTQPLRYMWLIRAVALFFLVSHFFIGPMPEAFAQGNYQFSHITEEDGLLDDMAYSVLQDSKGYFWFGTVAGLQRYDGHHFITYLHDARDPESPLKASVVRQLKEMSDGSIWIATQGGGISRFRDGRFLPALLHDPGDRNSLSSNLVEDMVEDASKAGVWIATHQGLNYYDYATGNITRYIDEISAPEVFSLALDVNGDLWLGTDDGLNKHLGNGRFRQYRHDAEDDRSVAGNFVHDIMSDRQGNLWLAIVGAGVDRLDLQTLEFEHYGVDPESPFGLSNSVALGLAQDPDGSIWVATWGGGLNRITTTGVEVFAHDESDPNTMLSSNVEEVMVDRSGNVWTANHLGGINRLVDVPIQAFEPYRLRDQDMLPTSALTAIRERRDGTIWYNAPNGVCYYQDGAFESYLFDPSDPLSEEGLSGSRASEIFEDSQGRMWIGNLTTGIDVVEGDRIRHLIYDPDDPAAIPSNQVISIEEDQQGRIWMAFVSDGLAYYEDGAFTHFVHNERDPQSLPSDRIRDITVDEQGRIWIATAESGLSYYDGRQFKSLTFSESDPYSLPQNALNAVQVDDEGQVWVGYVGGIARMDPNSRRFRTYDKKDGLAGIFVEEMDLDDQGDLWVATHSGASRYVKSLDKFESFGKESGITNPKLRSVHAGTNIYFGGPSGFYVLPKEKLFSGKSGQRTLTFTAMKAGGRDQQSSISAQAIIGEELEFSYVDNSFELFLSDLAGDFGAKLDFYYRVVGLSDDWIYTEGQHSIPFTFLNPGDYELQVRLPGDVAEVSSMKITINPPWWGTWWFRLLMFLALTAVVLAIIFWRRRLRLATELQLRKEVKEATDEIKLQRDELVKQRDSLHLALQETNQLIHEAIESGNLNARIDTTGKEGLWLDLASSLNGFFESITQPIKEMNAVIGEIANGDLALRFTGQVNGDLAALAGNLNLSLDSLNAFLREIRLNADDINDSAVEMMQTSKEANSVSGEIAMAISEISAGASKQVSIVDDSSNLLEYVLKLSLDVTDQARNINENAIDSNDHSEKGVSLMERVDASMQEISGYSEDTQQAMQELEKSAKEVTSFLTLMGEIAAQTNLLALNAAIEAAQAGDAGRGFAVVAEEIRKLAENSKRSLTEIQELIERMQSQTGTTSHKLAEMGQSISSGVGATKDSLQAFKKLADANGLTLQLSGKIAEASDHQTQSMKKVVSLVENVVVIAEETAAGTEELAASSSQLSASMDAYASKADGFLDIAETLSSGVSKFKLKEDSAREEGSIPDLASASTNSMGSA